MKVETKRFEGLTCIHGNPGKGKTYFLQKLALDYQKKGYLIVLLACGWSIKGAVEIFDSDELGGIYLNPNEHKERIAVFCDEANSVFPARDWAKTTKESRDYFAMFRHAGVAVFFYTTQDWEDTEKLIRSKTEFVWTCGFIRPLRLFYHRKFAKGDFLKLHSQLQNPKGCSPYAVTMFFAKALKGTDYNTYARYDLISSLCPQNVDIIAFLNKAITPQARAYAQRWREAFRRLKTLITGKFKRPKKGGHLFEK